MRYTEHWQLLFLSLIHPMPKIWGHFSRPLETRLVAPVDTNLKGDTVASHF